jgi:hypothetical protein
MTRRQLKNACATKKGDPEVGLLPAAMGSSQGLGEDGRRFLREAIATEVADCKSADVFIEFCNR